MFLLAERTKQSDWMGRIANSCRLVVRWFPWIFSGAASTFRKLPENSKDDIKDVAKNPDRWRKSIERAWDSSKIGADQFKETSRILSNILIGRNISKKERIAARDNLASLSIIVPPLGVFMIPGSQILLGIMARVTPWRLVPDDWIPIDALRTVREDGEDLSLEKESSLVSRLLGR